MTRILTLDGTRIHDIPSFYDEINRVFMQGVDWTLSMLLFPAIAVGLFPDDPRMAATAVGLLAAAPAVGAVVSGVFSGPLGQVRRQGRVMLDETDNLDYDYDFDSASSTPFLN